MTLSGKQPVRQQDWEFYNYVKKQIETFCNAYGVGSAWVTSIFRQGDNGAHGHDPCDAVDITFGTPLQFYIAYLWLGTRCLDKIGVFIDGTGGNKHLHITRWQKHVGRLWIEYARQTDGSVPIEPLSPELHDKLKETYVVKASPINVVESDRLFKIYMGSTAGVKLASNSGCLGQVILFYLLTLVGYIIYRMVS